MFNRIVYERLRTWANQDNRKPLILRGARQVGKTFAVRQLGEDFACFIELNMERAADREAFERELPVEDVFQAIVLRKKARPVKGKTLLFLDEIQECPAAVQMLRYFQEELPDLHVVRPCPKRSFRTAGFRVRGSGFSKSERPIRST